jgi:hypothetical protein
VTLQALLKQLEAIRRKADPPTGDALANFAQELEAYGAEREKEIEARDKEISDLKVRLEAAGQVSRASPTDIAKSFRAVIDEFHAEAREADDVAVAIKALDVEVKGLVEVDEQTTRLVLPSAGAAVDATALSTFRISFGAVPAVPADEAPEPEPAPKARKSRGRSKRS